MGGGRDPQPELSPRCGDAQGKAAEPCRSRKGQAGTLRQSVENLHVRPARWQPARSAKQPATQANTQTSEFHQEHSSAHVPIAECVNKPALIRQRAATSAQRAACPMASSLPWASPMPKHLSGTKPLGSKTHSKSAHAEEAAAHGNPSPKCPQHTQSIDQPTSRHQSFGATSDKPRNKSAHK